MKLLKSTILIVDDTIEFITLVSKILKKKNYRVLFARNGKEALEIIQNKHIDLVLLDIQMPHMDGFEIAEKIRSSDTKQIPIIFVTVADNTEDITHAFKSGAQDYITKPFNKEELLARIATHLSLSRANDYNIDLLRQYKQIVDKSSIVSKTDSSGRINYVNESFTHISGYTQAELIGKTHRLLKSGQTPISVFKNIWETITDKKTWKGTLSNKKKNGEIYYVKTTIMPILDENGEIKEFISLREDITDIYKLNEEIEETQKEILFTVGSIAETRSKETGNHVKRVAEYSKILATYAGLDKKQVALLGNASPMHDIGKVAIPDTILNKPGKLTEEESVIMKTHSELGYKMLSASKRPLLKTATTIAYEHHERWDGKGYPRCLKGEEISIEGRIVAIADVFDALGSVRCYKKAWSDEKIFALMKEERGKQFDPHLIDLFFIHLEDFLFIREEFRDKDLL